MSYIGQRPVVGRYIKLDQISSGFNGSETSFSMTAGSQAVFPGTARNLLLSLGGVIQEPDTNFTISGSTLTFTTAPVANTTFFAVIFGDMQSTGTPSDGTVLPASIASSGNFSFPQLTVTGTSSLGDDVTFTGANYNVVWDKSDNALEFADNAKAVFGTGNDLQIYHDGTNSFIQDTGTGDLYVRTSKINIQGANGDNEIVATQDGAVELYYDNSKKFETTTGGAKITGTATATGALIVGSGNDLQVTRSSGNTEIQNYNGTLLFGNASSNLNNVFIRGRADENSIICIPDGAVELYHNNSKKFETTSTGVAITGGLTTSGASTINADFTFAGASSKTITFDQSEGHIRYLDNAKAQFGTQGDLQIYHSGSQSYIKHNGTGNLYIDVAANEYFSVTSEESETIIQSQSNGAVELFYDGSKKFETTSGGVDISNIVQIGTSNDQGELRIGHDGTSYRARLVSNSSNSLEIDADGPERIQLHGGVIYMRPLNSEKSAAFVANGAAELYYDDSKKLETTSVGVTMNDTVITNGEIRPASDNNHSIGRSNRRYITYFGVNSPVNTSDKNEKNTIIDSDLGLDFINKLKPISYKWNKDDGKTHYGLIAQDLEETLTSLGKTIADFGGIYKEDDSPMGLGYSELIAPLIKAVQELSTEVAALKAA